VKNDVNVPSKKGLSIKNPFFGTGKVNDVKEQDPEPDPHPDPFVKGTNPRIRIHIPYHNVKDSELWNLYIFARIKRREETF
jgi:hypothetical protein